MPIDSPPPAVDGPTAAPPAHGRIDAIDALRGFALLGIVVAHMAEQYLGGPPPPSRPDFGIQSPIDQLARALYGLLVVGKFFPIFSLLFGISFVIQMERGQARGDAARGRFLWRLAILLVIGLAHHAVYRGDILSIYALLGAPLVLFHRASDRVVLATAAVLLSGLPRVLIATGSALLGQPVTLMPPPAAIETYFAAVAHGGLAEIAWINLTEGLASKLAFQFGPIGRGYQTLALFLLGLWLARHGWHARLADARPRLRRACWWGLGLIVAAVAGGAVTALIVGLPASPEAITWAQVAAGFTVLDLLNLGMATLWVAAFLLLYQRPTPGRWLRVLVPVGQTALTVYVTQTLVGTWLLYGVGLGWIGRIGTATAVLLALGIFAAQIVAAHLWVRRFRYGPLEWVWRSLTMGRAMPFLRV